MFGVSFMEIAVIGLVALVVVGPQKLPEMARTAGEWIGRLRRLTSDMRAQTGIDDILREEGIDGVAELRSLLRGERAMAARRGSQPYNSSYSEPADPAVEFPTEGPDAQGALPDDLLKETEADEESPRPDSKEATPTPAEVSPPTANLAPSSRPPAPLRAHKVPHSSLPPPPATPRPLPPRAVTHRETPVSKGDAPVTITSPKSPTDGPK